MVVHESASLQLFVVLWIFLRSLGVICYDRWVLSEGHKNCFKDWCLTNSHPTFLFLTYLNFWIMVILSKAWKPDNFELNNSLKLSFTNIWDLRSNFIDYESFLESNLNPDILALCETNLDDSIGSGNFSVRGYLPLIRKDSSTHMHGLAVYVKEGLPFARDLSLENSADSYLCFRLALLHSVSYFFFLYRSPFSSLCMAFDFILSNMNEFFSINPSTNMFVFRDFNVHHKESEKSESPFLGNFWKLTTSLPCCWDTLPCGTWQWNCLSVFTCWWKSLLFATSKFGILNIRWYGVIIKHLFLS